MKQPFLLPLSFHYDRRGEVTILAADGTVVLSDPSGDTPEGSAEYLVHCANAMHDLLQAAQSDLYAFDRIVALVNEARDGSADIDTALDIIMDFASLPAARDAIAKAHGE